MKRPKRVLLINDHAEDRALVVRQLRRELRNLQMVEITQAEAFEEALAQGDFDLAITDSKVHWADGFQILGEIKARRPGSPVIMVAEDGSEETAAAAIRAGVNEFINKSVHYLENLSGRVRSYLEQDRMRQGQKGAEAKNVRLFDRVPVGLYRLTPGGRVIDANPATVELLGYENLQDLLAVNSREFYAQAEDRRRWRQMMEQDGAVRNFEVQLRRRDGSIIWVRNHAQPIWDEQGRIIWYEGSSEDITAWKQAEEALKESESKYRLLFENNPQPMLVYDRETLAILKVNQAAVAHYGYSREEFLAMTIKEIRPPEDVPMLLEKLAQASSGLRYAGERRHRKKSGEIMEVDIVSHDIAINGRQARLVLVRDVTAQKRAEEALRESERFLASIFDSIQDGLCILDNDLNIVRVNATAENWYAHAQPLVGKKCYEAIHYRDRPCKVCPAQSTLETGKTMSGILPKRGPGGKPVGWLEFFAFPLVDSTGGKIKGVIKYVRDITAKRQAEIELQETNEFLQSILQASAAAIVYRDQAGQVRIWNKAAARMFGWEAEEVLGWPAPFIPGNQEDEHLKLLERVLEGEVWTGMEAQRRRKDGSLISVSVSVAPVRNAQGEIQGTLAIITDITARKLTEEALRQKEEQLRQAQKMEAVGRLAGGVAHDFNNLLTAIMGYGELLLMNLQDQGQAHLVEQIIQVSERAATLIRQLLALSRRQPLKLEPLDLNQVVAGLEQLLHRVIGEDILLHTNLQPERQLVQADRSQVEQVIMNLVMNARDAMPHGGEMFIKTYPATLNESQVESMPEAHAGAFMVLEVADTGQGINQEIRERIFEPFFTTKGVGEGTGLGLSTVYGIVKQHEGWIKVCSEPGRGTRFQVHLPLVSTAAAAKSSHALSLKKLEGNGERLLVVEDEDELRDIATRMLRQKGYEVVAAATVAEAVAAFEQEQGNFQLVFSDVVLSDQSGLQLVEELKKRKPDLRVALTSGYADQKVQWPIIQERKYPFLQKPYNLNGLLKIIAATLTGKEP